MTGQLPLGGRVLILAPHPDDESIATGGLIQHVVAAGGEPRIIFLTLGDNNPWPQRVIERRWRIGPAEREHWGSRRRGEALNALSELGIPDNAAAFWGYPDQGLTSILLSGDVGITERLLKELIDWRPGALVTPSPLDLHPDHSALGVFVRLALARAGVSPAHIEYVIHGRGPGTQTIALSAEQQGRKRLAISRHLSQLWFRPGLVNLATPVELFEGPTEMSNLSNYPVRRASVTGDEIELDLTLSPRPGAFGRVTMYLLAEQGGRLTARLGLRLPLLGGGKVDVRDEAGEGRVVGRAFYGGGSVRIPLKPLATFDHLYAKVERRFGFFDEAGWCMIKPAFAL